MSAAYCCRRMSDRDPESQCHVHGSHPTGGRIHKCEGVWRAREAPTHRTGRNWRAGPWNHLHPSLYTSDPMQSIGLA